MYEPSGEHFGIDGTSPYHGDWNSPSPRKMRIVPPQRSFPTSWGVGLKIFIGLWVVVVLFPLALIWILLDSEEIPAGMVWLSLSLLVGVCLFVSVVLVCMPWSVSRDSDILGVSMCGSIVRRVRISDILWIRRVCWREFLFMRFVGFPTDWCRCVGVSVKGQRPVLFSLKSPDEFIEDVLSIESVVAPPEDG